MVFDVPEQLSKTLKCWGNKKNADRVINCEILSSDVCRVFFINKTVDT